MKIKVVDGQPYGAPMDFGDRQVDTAVWKTYVPLTDFPDSYANIAEDQYDADDDVVRQVLVVNPNYSNQLAEDARIDRNNLLASSDWTQMPDSPLSNADKTAWATYRTALRDVPSQSGFPTNIIWPTQPDEA